MERATEVAFCVVCGKEATKICSMCKAVSYCGKKCQRIDWKSHEPTCKLVLDNVPWCDICHASQDLTRICFRCGFVFCKPCYESRSKKKRCRCPGCSRPMMESCDGNQENARALTLLADKEECPPNVRRNFWYNVLGSVHELLEPKNIPLAKHYFNLSGNLGYGEGYVTLGKIYLKEGDWLRAKEVLENGADLQSTYAMFLLGKCYVDGTFDGNTDYRVAQKWLKEGARLGDGDCTLSLGVAYYLGKGTPLNYDKAIARFRRGADKGDAQSQCMLGICYRRGQGVVESSELARYWWEKAAAQGDETAMDFLRKLW